MNCFTISHSRKNLIFLILTLLLILFVTYSIPLAAYAGSSSQTISASNSHTLAINSKGELFAWGDNNYGQLGTGTITSSPRSSPLKIGTATNWTAVSAGYNYSLALNSKGELYAWGLNDGGQLGFHTESYAVPTPTRVGTGISWIAISAGHDHSLGLTSQGQLFVWEASEDYSFTLTQITSATNWTAISAGFGSFYAINSQGQLFAWGNNNYGQLGDGTLYNRYTPVRSTNASDWVAIAAGYYHSLAINSKGQLFAWGENSYGELGDSALAVSSPPKRVITAPVADNWAAAGGGGSTSLMLKSNGDLFACGYNENGQAGNGNVLIDPAPLAPVLQLGAPSSVFAQQRITFVTDTGALSSARTAQNGSALGTLPASTRAGHTFASWWTAPTGGAQVSATTLVRSDMVLHARYTPLPPAPIPVLRTVTFNASGTTVHTRQVEQGKALGTLPAAPVRTGQDFTGWFTQVSGGVQVQSTHLVTADMTLYARYVPKSYTLTFNSAGGSSVAARTLSHGTAVGSLPTPTRKGFRFMGWFLPSGARLSESTLIAADTTVTARWTSTNAKLKNIKPSTGKLNRKFAASRTAYTLPLSRKKSRVTVTASPAHSKAKVEFHINKKWKKTNSQTVRLSRGSSQTVKIRVSAEDKQTVRTYTVKVTRAR